MRVCGNAARMAAQCVRGRLRGRLGHDWATAGTGTGAPDRRMPAGRMDRQRLFPAPTT